MAGFIFGAGTDVSDPKELARRRAVIDAMMAQERGTPRNVGEGIYSFSKSITDAITSRNLKRQEDKAREEAAGGLGRIVDLLGMGGQSYGGASAPAVSTQPIARTPDSAGGIADDTMKALGKTPMGPYRDAIASIESAGSGDYSAIGPTNQKLGRALGRYQIMEANIGPWSREILGREVTPDEFLANPQIQDAIFDGKFGGYVEKFGPEGAAQAWFAGPGGVGKMDRQDVLGTSVADYTQKFSAALGGQPSGQPAQPNAGTRTFNPEIINQLAALSSNPYASEGQRQIAALLMQQQVQQMMPQDPMKALELERAQLEIQKMRNPQGYRQVRGSDLGLSGAQGDMLFNVGPDGKVSQIGGNGTTVNVGGDGSPGLGKLSTDYGYVLDPVTRQPVIDPATGLPMSAPVPGSPAAREIEAAAAADAAKGNQKDASTALVMDEINLARELIKDESLFSPATGVTGGLASNIDSTRAGALKNRLETIKANIGFDKLQAMREASPTGGALGAVSEFENRLLQAVYGSLVQSQRQEDLLYNLDRLETIYNRIINQGIPEDEARALYREITMGDKAPTVPSSQGGNRTSSGVSWSIEE